MKCLPILAGLALGACGAPDSPVPAPVPLPVPEEPEQPADADYHTAASRAGKYTIQWRPVARGDRGGVPKNEHFELEVKLYKNIGDELVPVPGVRLAVSGWMPAHGHGMIRQPQAIDQGGGSYLVRGMLFHMGGHWELYFDVIEDGLSERTDFELDL